MTNLLRDRWIALGAGLCLTVGLFQLSPNEADASTQLTVAMADDVVLDPHLAPLPGSWIASRLIHRGLFAFPDAPYPGGLVPIPDIALGPIVEVSQTLYEISLRSAQFSNGAEMTANDVVRSLQRFRKRGGAIAKFASPIKSILAASSLGGADAIRIKTTRAMPDLSYLLAHPQAAIIPASTGSQVSTLGPRGLGPYRVISRQLEANVVLGRNPHWNQGEDDVRSALPARVVLRIRRDGASAFKMVKNGSADLIGDPGPPDVLDVNLATVRSASRCTRIVAINNGASGLDQLSARRAIRNVLEGIDLPTPGTARAASLLPSMVVGSRERPRDRTESRITVKRTMDLAGSDTRRDRAELATIAEHLRKAGARVSIQIRHPALHSRLLAAPASRRPDLLLFTWCAEWPGLAGRTFMDPLTGPGKLAPRSDQLKKAISSASQVGLEKAEDSWRAADRILRDLAVLVPVGWPAELAAFPSYAQDPQTSPMFPQGDPTNTAPAP